MVFEDLNHIQLEILLILQLSRLKQLFLKSLDDSGGSITPDPEPEPTPLPDDDKEPEPKLDLDDEFYRIYDYKKMVAGYFDPDYGKIQTKEKTNFGYLNC